jgi:hypothetical protein
MVEFASDEQGMENSGRPGGTHVVRRGGVVDPPGRMARQGFVQAAAAGII